MNRLTVKILSAFFMVLLVPGGIYSQNSDSIQTENIITKIYNFDFDAAEMAMLSHSINQNHEIAVTVAHKWWKDISLDRSHQELLCYLENKVITSEALSDEENLFINASLLKILLSDKKYLKAWKSWKSFEKNIHLQSSHTNSPLATGLYYCIKAELQHQLPVFVRDTVPFYENLQRGVIILEKCSKDKNPVISTEATYYLMRIYYDFLKDEKNACRHAENLVQKYPDNYIYRYYYCIILKDSGKNNKASQSALDGLEALLVNKYDSMQRVYCHKILSPFILH